MRKNIKQEDGLPLEETKHSTSPQEPQPQLCDLPRPPKRKKYAGRVGERASTNQELTGVKTGIDKIGTAVRKTVPVHNIPYDSLNFVESTTCMSAEETVTLVQESHLKLEDEKEPCLETEEQDIQITKVTHAKNNNPKSIRKRLDKAEEHLILNDQMVTDLSINVAQNMLHE